MSSQYAGTPTGTGKALPACLARALAPMAPPQSVVHQIVQEDDLLAADRANATRRELVAAGMPDAKLARVVGLAASDPLEPDHPRAPLNRRITITVLTHEAEERLLSKNKREVPIEQLLPEKQDNPAPEKQP